MTFDLRPAADGSSTELVVIVHGLRGRVLETVPDVVASERPSADLLMPRYDAGPRSQASAVDLAATLSDGIQSQCARRSGAGAPYRRITLIGHSRGALLVRKAYVFARGENQELWKGGLRPEPKPWAGLVDRVVLLAGMNRGWSLTPKPPQMRYWRWLWLKFLNRVALVTRQGGLLRDIQRGSPFVANLRVQWIRLNRLGGMPLTVQILGDMDDLVAKTDNIDLQSGQDFVYLDAPRGTTHAGVVEMGAPAVRAVFVRALQQPRETLKSDYTIPASQRQDPSVRQVVFLVHGIRDFGGWTTRLGTLLKARAHADGRALETIRPSYGYFPMGRFLLFSERQKNVRWFMDRYTEALARYPNAESIDFIGHSNGTYLLGSALRRYAACNFGRAVCAGSVLPRDFEWDDLVEQGRLTGIRNYLASRDWIVGVFPNVFDRWGDIGGAGFLGFVREPAAGSEFQYISGGHGAAIAVDNLDSIAAFVLEGSLVPPPDAIRRDRQSAAAVLASKFDWAVWLLMLAIVVAAAWLLAYYLPSDLLPYPWLRALIFVGVLILILNSV